LHQLCSILRTGISSFDMYEEFVETFEKLRCVVPGGLGIYHYKNAYAVLIATNWIPPRYVTRIPVDPGKSGGTATGLREVYQSNTSSRNALEEMLTELVHRLRCESFAADHHGTVGMALCWRKRLRTPSQRRAVKSRCEEARVVWKQQLSDLDVEGIKL
jgi:hypothetical protein